MRERETVLAFIATNPKKPDTVSYTGDIHFSKGGSCGEKREQKDRHWGKRE